jgi:hypothetical protein
VSDADIRLGWTTSENDYTTCCPVCQPQVSGGYRRRFVARFAVFSESALWAGNSGLRSPLYCEYLPPGVLRKELQRSITSSQFGLFLRVKSPTLFWNLVGDGCFNPLSCSMCQVLQNRHNAPD